MLHHRHLNALAELYQSETQPFRKVHRMIDLFESIIKTHTVVILGEYVKHNKLSDAAKGMLAQGLRTPSLGTWQLFSRVMFEELKADGYAWAFDGFFDAFTALDKALNADKTNVIAFRNGYAHGATPTDAQCEADIQKFEPFLNKLLQSQWLTATRLETRESKVWVISDVAEVCVHPVLLHKADGGNTPYAFFNDLKNDKVGLLNYPLSKHYREKEFYKEFHEYLPLHEWKKTGNNEFFQRIEELTETFKGRTQEREQLLHFVREKHKGYFSIQGNPGIGKSALIAQFFKDLRANDALKHVQVVEYFIRRGTAQAQIEYLLNYLIKRTDELFGPGKEIRAEGKAVWDLQQQLFAKWRLWGEQCEGKKLLFLIDGLDEGTENNVVSYMPRENFEGVLIIYGSRPGGHKTIDELWTQLPTEHHTKLELAGLSREDIRALIYEVANKYEVERDSAWIEAVQQRSQGNPLYMKLLCDALEHGSIALNDIQALPDKIDEYYKAILDRYAADMLDGDALLAGLFTFAAAKDYLTMGHLGLINKLGDATIQRIGSTLKEVLYENPLTEGVLDYQLFHESFREYLIKEKPLKVIEAAERIIDFCGNWLALASTWEERYALEHYATHLSESKKEARGELLMNLLYDTPYAAAQKNVLKNFDASNRLYQTILLKASCIQSFDNQLVAALCLVDLKYEEANDAPQVIAMVARGEIDLALKRIESFGGTDKEGVKRRFTLYMLCLMELTLLESKNKPFRKDFIEKLLNYLDEQLPVDYSILKWNDFFPSYVVFLMACEWAALELDYWIVFKRTDDWEKDWIKEKGPYSDLQLKLLIDCAIGINNEYEKSRTIREISAELAKHNKFDEALKFAKCISNETEKSIALKEISFELGINEKYTEAIECISIISDKYHKFIALKVIASRLGIHGQMKEAESVLIEASECIESILEQADKCEALANISTELAKHNKLNESASKMDEAIKCARGISNEQKKIKALKGISSELAKQNNKIEAESMMQDAFDCALGMRDDFFKSNELIKISTEMAKKGYIEESIECARVISEDSKKSFALLKISIELTKQEKILKAASVKQESLECAKKISINHYKSSAYYNICNELAIHGNIKEAIEYLIEISNVREKIITLNTIYNQLGKFGKIEEVTILIQKELGCISGIKNYTRNLKLNKISLQLLKQDKVNEALVCAREIKDYAKSITLNDISTKIRRLGMTTEAATVFMENLEGVKKISEESVKSNALRKISKESVTQGLVHETIETARGINSTEERIKALIAISTELFKQGEDKESELIMHEALECIGLIKDEKDKCIVKRVISSEFVIQGKLEESIECIQEITIELQKSIALREISILLAEQGKFEDANKYALEINETYQKSIALKYISIELASQDKIEEALLCVSAIIDMKEKSSALLAIAKLQRLKGTIEETLVTLNLANEYAFQISADYWKNRTLNMIYSEYANQGNWAFAEKKGLEIIGLANRHELWKNIGKSTLKKNGWQSSLEKLQELKSDEARLFYLKGWTEAVNLQEADAVCIQASLSLMAKDSESIENLLQKHALHEVFFANASQEKINQLNRSLNIQWALDIAAQFPKEESSARLSTKLHTWLHEIADEDDREQIELWAKQVAKGKITEEEFGERVKGIL